MGRRQLLLRFIKTKAAPILNTAITLPLAPLLRLVYESSYVPRPARLEAEQPADEFVCEIELGPHNLNCDVSPTKYGNFTDESIGVML